MILLLHNDALFLKNYTTYLDQHDISYYALHFQECITSVEIFDVINGDHCTWTLYDHNQYIDFSKISGIYHTLRFLDICYFHMHGKTQQEAARYAWLAYFYFKLRTHPNVINRVSPESLSGLLYNFPYVYHIASHYFLTPRYCISTNPTDIITFANTTPVIAQPTLLMPTLLSKNIPDPHTTAAIEYQEGITIVTHCIGEKIYASTHEKNKHVPIQLPQKIHLACQHLIKRLGLTVAEILFRYTPQGQYYFYALSPTPQWEQNAHPTPDLYKQLNRQLLTLLH